MYYGKFSANVVNLLPIMVSACSNVFKYKTIIILTIKSVECGILSLLSQFRTYVAHKMQIHPFFLLNYKHFHARGRLVYGFNRQSGQIKIPQTPYQEIAYSS